MTHPETDEGDGLPEEVFLRDAHKGKNDPCWVPCAKGDPGAVRFIPDPE